MNIAIPGLFSALAASQALAVTGVGPNLLQNGDAEANAGASNFGSVVVPAGWTTTDSLTAVNYSAGGSGDLNTAYAATIGGGNVYFAGGPNSASSSASQSVAVGSLQPQLGGGQRWFRIGGMLGGFASQEDNTTFAVSVGALHLIIGPVTAANRNNTSSLLWRSSFGILPTGATVAQFVLAATRTAGSYNDGYADNLAFQMTAEPGDATLDRNVNFDDLLRLAQGYGSTGQMWETGDFTGDGSVGFEDLLLLAQHYGNTGLITLPADVDPAFAADWSTALAVVPEPMSLAGVLLVTRRRRCTT